MCRNYIVIYIEYNIESNSCLYHLKIEDQPNFHNLFFNEHLIFWVRGRLAIPDSQQGTLVILKT